MLPQKLRCITWFTSWFNHLSSGLEKQGSGPQHSQFCHFINKSDNKIIIIIVIIIIIIIIIITNIVIFQYFLLRL